MEYSTIKIVCGCRVKSNFSKSLPGCGGTSLATICFITSSSTNLLSLMLCPISLIGKNCTVISSKKNMVTIFFKAPKIANKQYFIGKNFSIIYIYMSIRVSLLIIPTKGNLKS